MDFPPRTKSRTSTKYGTFVTPGDAAGGGRTITEHTASTVVPGSMAARGDMAADMAAAGTAGGVAGKLEAGLRASLQPAAETSLIARATAEKRAPIPPRPTRRRTIR